MTLLKHIYGELKREMETGILTQPRIWLERCISSVIPQILRFGLSFPQVCPSFATDHRQREGTFYEFCTYYLKPSNVEEFLYNFKKNVHLRTAHSELVGYWSVGFGGRINTVFHIWKYGMSYQFECSIEIFILIDTA